MVGSASHFLSALMKIENGDTHVRHWDEALLAQSLVLSARSMIPFWPCENNVSDGGHGTTAAASSNPISVRLSPATVNSRLAGKKPFQVVIRAPVRPVDPKMRVLSAHPRMSEDYLF